MKNRYRNQNQLKKVVAASCQLLGVSAAQSMEEIAKPRVLERNSMYEVRHGTTRAKVYDLEGITKGLAYTITNKEGACW